MKKKTGIVVIIAAIFFIVIVIAIVNVIASEKNKQLNPDKVKILTTDEQKNFNERRKYDIEYGEGSIRIIEYGSLTCHHCAAFFAQAHDRILKDYSGRVKIVHASIIGDIVALRANKLLFCNKVSPENKGKLLEVLYKTQQNWVLADENKSILGLNKIFNQLNLPEGDFDACMKDKNLENEIIKDQMQLRKNLEIHATPIIVIGNVKIQGYVDYDVIKSILDKELSQTSNQ